MNLEEGTLVSNLLDCAVLFYFHVLALMKWAENTLSRDLCSYEHWCYSYFNLSQLLSYVVSINKTRILLIFFFLVKSTVMKNG